MSYGMPERGAHPWTLDEAQSRPFIARALELGINFFDTSNSYSDGTSEEILGRAVRDLARRDEVVIATKVFYPDAAGPERPGPVAQGDPDRDRREPAAARAPTTSTSTRSTAGTTRRRSRRRWRRLHDVVKAGKARYLGASSMFAWQFCKALYLAEPARLDAVRLDAGPLQPALSRGGAGDAGPLRGRGHRRAPLEPAGPRAAGPAMGREGTARRAPGRTSSARPSTPGRRRPTGRSWTGSARWPTPGGCPRHRLRWHGCWAGPAVTSPIIGATKPHHLEDAVAALSIELSSEEWRGWRSPTYPTRSSGSLEAGLPRFHRRGRGRGNALVFAGLTFARGGAIQRRLLGAGLGTERGGPRAPAAPSLEDEGPRPRTIPRASAEPCRPRAAGTEESATGAALRRSRRDRRAAAAASRTSCRFS